MPIVSVCSIVLQFTLFNFYNMPHLYLPLQLNSQAVSSTIE